MLITRKSNLSGTETTKDLEVTQEQMDNYKRGALLQNAFPLLSAKDRDFIRFGFTDKEWEDLYGKE